MRDGFWVNGKHCSCDIRLMSMSDYPRSSKKRTYVHHVHFILKASLLRASCATVQEVPQKIELHHRGRSKTFAWVLDSSDRELRSRLAPFKVGSLGASLTLWSGVTVSAHPASSKPSYQPSCCRSACTMTQPWAEFIVCEEFGYRHFFCSCPLSISAAVACW